MGIQLVRQKPTWPTQIYNFFAQKKVLVTGGCGFIGSHLAEALVECGAQVSILDNLSSGNIDNIKHIDSNITFIENDIRDYIACVKAVENIDIIFHLAAYIAASKSVQEPRECVDANVAGTFHMLEVARLTTIKKFIFASSAAVYGNHEGLCDEKTTPCNPTSPYGLSKCIGEQLCSMYTNLYGLPTQCLRFFNVYGPRQDGSKPNSPVIARFIYCLQHNIPITIYGDGYQTRDFIHVYDVVNALLFSAMLPTNNVINVASGVPTSLHEILEQLTHKDIQHIPQITFKPRRAGDIYTSVGSVQQLNALLLNTA